MKYSCIDQDGMYLSDAVGLLKGGEVDYFTNHNSKFFSEYTDYMIGSGFGVKKPLEFFPTVDTSDVIVNFALNGQDLVEFLRKHFPNKAVYGAGKGRILETDRWALKKILKAAGFDVPKSELIVGVKNLIEHLKKTKDVFIKSRFPFKGVMDTFPAPDYEAVEMLINDISQELGSCAEEFEFIVEHKIDTDQEWGVDCFFNGEDYVKPYIHGVEFGKNCYMGKVSNTLPPQLQDTLDRLKPVLKQLDYRGGFATEEKIVDKKKHYLLDFTSRLASPFGSGMPFVIDNWDKLVSDIASKKPTKIETKYLDKYVCTVPIDSGHLELHNTKLMFDPKYKDNIKFEKAFKKGEDYIGIRKAEENVICIVVNGADTIKDLIKSTKKIVDTIKCYECEKGYINELDNIEKITASGDSVGITF